MGYGLYCINNCKLNSNTIRIIYAEYEYVIFYLLLDCIIYIIKIFNKIEICLMDALVYNAAMQNASKPFELLKWLFMPKTYRSVSYFNCA